MKTIRKNCFETNSSSTHSLTIFTKNKTYTKKDTKHLRGLEVECGEFGWENKTYTSPIDKASYFWTLAQSNKKLHEKLQEVGRRTGLIFVKPEADSRHYVDHGSEHYENFISAYPELKTIDGLIGMIVSDAELETGNDNE